MKRPIWMLTLGAFVLLVAIAFLWDSGEPDVHGASPRPRNRVDRTPEPGPEAVSVSDEADFRTFPQGNESGVEGSVDDAERVAQTGEAPDFEKKYADYGAGELRLFAELILDDIRRSRMLLVKDKLSRGEHRPLNSTDRVHVGGLAAVGGYIGKDEAGNHVSQKVEIARGESEELDALQEEYSWLRLKLRSIEGQDGE